MGKGIFLPYLITSEVGLGDIENRINAVCLICNLYITFLMLYIIVLYLKGNFFPVLALTVFRANTVRMISHSPSPNQLTL